MSKPGFNLWFDVKNLQLYKTENLEYVREISSIRYKIESYDDKAKCEAKDKCCKRLEDI